MSIRIAFYMPSLEFGGVERVVLNLAAGMAKRNFAVDLVVASATGRFIQQVPKGVQLINLHSERVLLSLPKLISYLRTAKPDIMISAKDQANIILIVAKLLSLVNTKIIVTIHSFILPACKANSTFKSRITPYLSRVVYPAADSIVAVSKAVAENSAELLRMPLEKITTIYNPVISKKLFELSQSESEIDMDTHLPVILAVGRLAKEKDYSTLLKAFAGLVKYKKARLIIIGEGEERERLEETIKVLGVESLVTLAGYKDNPYTYMLRAAVVVVSSLWEGLPTVLIEALAFGINVVSTDCGGPREILQDGLLGELVPVSDEIALEKAICRALAKKPMLCQESLHNFTLDFVVDRYLSLVAVKENAKVL